MNTQEILQAATHYFNTLPGHIFDLVSITKPISPDAAINLAKVISKLSPLLGNLIEFNIVELLNNQEEFQPYGKWSRQDPGFPDAIFQGAIHPTPGFEIKAWFPLATEMTARFKDSQNHFVGNNTYVLIIAWLPEWVIFGKPQILGISVVSGLSIALARDNHYHNLPDYLVIEPEDTSSRTRNLQQTNTSGYKWQGTPEEFEAARKLVEEWGLSGSIYQPTPAYQMYLRELTTQYKYRLDTNFAKIDRIIHDEIEQFKQNIYNIEVHGMSVGRWNTLFSSGKTHLIKHVLEHHLGIIESDPDEILE